jgi:hypothetical protein
VQQRARRIEINLIFRPPLTPFQPRIMLCDTFLSEP